jgi:O-succinylbenzoic acid--CoA ligase
MTETASQIATLHPDAFLSGNSSSGTVLPHACITICDAAGQSLESNQIGRVTIQAESLALGYYPVLFSSDAPFEVDDLGFLNRQDYLTIVGRRSHKIITGGENVFPEEVEAAIQATNLVEDVGVVGMPDRYWGEVIVAIYRPKHGAEVKAIAPETWRFLLSRTLAKFKHPKYWIVVEQLPRNAQGKINREQLKQIATEQINRDPITG